MTDSLSGDPLDLDQLASEIAALVANEVMCPEHGYAGASAPINAAVREKLEAVARSLRDARQREESLKSQCNVWEFHATGARDALDERNRENDSLRAALAAAAEREALWRELLWLRHGCPTHMLYGDDGEMQCNHCMADFKRMPPEKVREIWERGTITEIARAALSPTPTEPQK